MTDATIDGILQRMSKTLTCQQLRVLKTELRALQEAQTLQKKRR